MKNTISILTMAAFVAAGFASCNTTDENEAPTVAIMGPSSENNPHMNGAPMHIHVEAEDDEELHEVAISIVRVHDGTEVYHSHAHPDKKTYSLHEDTVFTTMMHSDFTVTATASDHNEKSTTVTETIHMHPM
jgi:hypothetical protein